MTNAFFKTCDDYLSQGDIFNCPLVAPFGDHDIRIFRSSDAKHGSWVFENGGPYKVFDLQDLEATIETFPTDPLRTPPFQITNNQHEMVIVFGDLLKYFVIGSQTCDISGVDKRPLPLAAIIPMKPLNHFCKNIPVPFEIRNSSGDSIIYSNTNTIMGFISEHLDIKVDDIDDFNFSSQLKNIFDKWKPQDFIAKNIRGKIKGFLNAILQNKNLHTHYIPPDTTFTIPEGFVDFTHFITVPTSSLETLIDNRLATIKTPYREEFQQRISHFLSRIATPTPMKGETL